MSSSQSYPVFKFAMSGSLFNAELKEIPQLAYFYLSQLKSRKQPEFGRFCPYYGI